MSRAGIAKVGFDGEWKALDIIRKAFDSKGAVMQVDWIFQSANGNYFVVEVKHQEYYKAPPFDGHGLPKWQVDARLEFYKKTDIRPILLVIEKPFKAVYAQFLDILNEDKNNYFDTRGSSPRRVYRLDLFKNKTDECRLKGII